MVRQAHPQRILQHSAIVLGAARRGRGHQMTRSLRFRGASAPLAGTTSASSREIDGATSRGFLNRAFGGQAQNHAAIVLAAQLHYQPVSVGHRLRVAVEALQGYRVEEGMAAAEIEQPVDGLEA